MPAATAPPFLVRPAVPAAPMHVDTPPPRTLLTEPVGRSATIARVVAPHPASDWAHRLADIGFIPGERVMVTARGLPGGDPLAVRVGLSTFALRRAEAACIQLQPDEALP